MKTITILLLAILLAGCGESYIEKGSPDYIKEINDWHSKRINNLKRESSWLNLVGLLWLNEGDNTIGSDKSNSVVFPETALPNIGLVNLENGKVTFQPQKGNGILVDSVEVESVELINDMEGRPNIVTHGSHHWYIVKRGERYGIRLRDNDAPLLKSFSGIDRFPVNDDWKINAKFEKYDEPKILEIPNILGTIDKGESPGELVFNIGEKEYKLNPVSAGNGLFAVFADMTNGEETYGAGRFLYMPGPDSLGNVIVDFNKAYNPPCVFTKYATCPLPPEENKLRVKITAGEKSFGKGH